MTEDEETHITELTIAPDGRVYVFGMSRQIVEILELLRPEDLRLQKLAVIAARNQSNGCTTD